MINENRVYMKRIHKVAKGFKKIDSTLDYKICIKIAFKQVDKIKTIKIAKILDRILNYGIFGLTGL